MPALQGAGPADRVGPALAANRTLDIESLGCFLRGRRAPLHAVVRSFGTSIPSHRLDLFGVITSAGDALNVPPTPLGHPASTQHPR